MTNSKLLAAALGGAALGAALGVLLAPQTGKETRKQILKSSRKPLATVEELIEEGKKTWYETKGKIKMGTGIAADELDEFMYHILGKGRSAWSRAKDTANEIADEAESNYDSARNQGRKIGNNVKETASNY